jgi:universal stress protein E
LVALTEPRAKAQPLLARASAIAANTGARLVLFHAVFEPALTGEQSFDTPRIDQVRRDLLLLRSREIESHATRLRRADLKVEVLCVWDEPPHEAIIRAALDTKAGLVIAGPHARSDGPRSPWRLRHTDWQLLRLCPVPLLLARSRPRARGIVLTALDPTHASDSKRSFDKALARTASIVAEALQFELHGVHCIAPSEALLGETTATLHRRLEQERTLQLQRLLRAARADASSVQVIDGMPDVAIPECARRLGADILAIGSVSRRGLAKYVFGNTAERIVDAVEADLLIVKPPKLQLPAMPTKRASMQYRSKRASAGRQRGRV